MLAPVMQPACINASAPLFPQSLRDAVPVEVVVPSPEYKAKRVRAEAIRMLEDAIEEAKEAGDPTPHQWVLEHAGLVMALFSAVASGQARARVSATVTVRGGVEINLLEAFMFSRVSVFIEQSGKISMVGVTNDGEIVTPPDSPTYQWPFLPVS
jgi:hypothetical protein